MKNLICEWLRKREQQTTLFDEDGEVTLTYKENTLLLGVQLTSTRSDGVALECWARLGAASLVHFQGALAQNPDTGALWLTQSLKGNLSESSVLDSLTDLLNQRDAWRAIFARPLRPPLSVKPVPLRSQLY